MGGFGVARGVVSTVEGREGGGRYGMYWLVVFIWSSIRPVLSQTICGTILVLQPPFRLNSVGFAK